MHKSVCILLFASGTLWAANPGIAWDSMSGLEPNAIRQMLQDRKDQQARAGLLYTAFHGFQFSDRILESQIRFQAQIVDDVGRHNKPVHYDHGTGVAVADVDSDGLLDIYFVSLLGGNGLWKNVGAGRFQNITESAGVALADRICVAAAFADIDNDGDPDLFVTTVRKGNALFENLGGGKFKDISKEAGVDYVGHSSGAVFFDYDRDGKLDLFVANVGKYTSDKQGRGGYYVGISNAFSGHLDARLSELSLLYHNEGNNRFKAASEVLQHSAWSGEAVFGDLNEDGFPDLYVLNMQGDDKFYLNEQGKKFVERTAAYFPKTPWGAMGAKIFDYNNDGRLDLYVTDMHSDMTDQQIYLQRNFSRAIEKAKSEAFCAIQWTEEYLRGSANNVFGNAFYQASGPGKFIEVSDHINAETYWPWGPSVGDLNADGYEDVFVTAGMGYPFGYAVNSVLLNENGKRFLDAEFLLGIEPRARGRVVKNYFTLDCAGEDKGHPQCEGETGRVAIQGTLSSRSAAIFDLDGDGDLDIVTNEINDPPQVFVSNLSEKIPVKWLGIKLKGTKSNRDGLGAIVTVHAGGRKQTRSADGKSGYLAQSSMPLYFAGMDGTVGLVTIRWPSGTVQSVTEAIKVNSTMEISEPAN
jgi:enediyne biosynthesis protein E4